MSINLPGVDTVTCTEAVGRLLWCGHNDGSVSIREPQDNGVVEIRQYRSGIRTHVPTAMLWVGGDDENQNIETVWIGWDDGRITVIDSLEFTTVGSSNVHSARINMLAQHQQWVFSCSSDTFIHRYDAASTKPIKKISYSGHTGPVRCITCTGEVLLSCAEDSTCKVWSCKTASEVMNLSFPISRNDEREEIIDRLHSLSEQVASLNLREESKHYQHLLPDHLVVETDRSQRISEIRNRESDRKRAMNSQRKRLHHKPPLPTSRTPARSNRTRDRSVSSEPPEPRDSAPTEFQVKSPPLGIVTTATPPSVVPRSGGFMSSPPPVASSPPLPLGYPHSQVDNHYVDPSATVPQPSQQTPMPSYSMKLNIDPNSGGPVVVSLDDPNSDQQQHPNFQIAERPVKRSSCTAWRLQFRTEIRMLRNFYLNWYYLCVAHKRTEGEILAEHMKNVSDAGVVVRYLKKWLERVALERSPAKRSISPAPLPPVATSPVAQRIVSTLSEVVLPEVLASDPPSLSVIIDSSCLLSCSPFSNESLKTFLSTCRNYNFEVIVFLESVDHHYISILRAADEHQAVTHCVNAPLKMSNISNRNPDSTLLVIPSPPSPSTYGNTLVAPITDSSVLEKLTEMISRIATGGFHSVASALPVILQREPQPAMYLS